MCAVLIGDNDCCREVHDAMIGTPVGELAFALALGAIERSRLNADAGEVREPVWGPFLP